MNTLAEKGFQLLPALLTRQQCLEIRSYWPDADQFRSTIDMRRYRFGQGCYKYFANPLPPLIATLRARLYEQLAPLVPDAPPSHADFLARCHAAGQLRPTPLLLRYEAGDYNCLHQDLYGDVYFPYQVVILLSDPQTEFSGGELILTEQQPRAQSIPRVVPLVASGDGAVITTHHRVTRNARGGTYRAVVRHGVSEVRSGERFTLGLIFHDAQ